MAVSFSTAGYYVYTSPKVLSTSLGLLAFELENNKPYEPFLVAGQSVQIHKFYPNKPFTPVDKEQFPFVFAFFRHPNERFLSLYRNRVLRKHPRVRAQWAFAEARGLNPLPTLQEFATKFSRYRRLVPDVAHHSRPQVDFTGLNVDYFDRIFSPENVQEFEALLSSRLGRAVTLPKAQASDNSVDLGDFGSALKQVKFFYRNDFDFWKAAFPGD